MPGPLYLEQVTAFLARLDALGMPTCVIYSAYSHILSYLAKPSVASRYELWANLGRHPLWLAQYHSTKIITLSGPNVPRPWVSWHIWQNSADGNMLGRAYGAWSNSIDLDVMQE